MYEHKIEKNRTVAVLLFEEVEILDFAGPMEVFSVANDLSGGALWQTITVSLDQNEIQTRYGLNVVAEAHLSEVPHPHLAIIPGGRGVQSLLKNHHLCEKLSRWLSGATHLISVCTGALVLANAGFLDGLSATTHYENLEQLRKIAPKASVVQQRYTDNGAIICAEGISAGIDASLYYIQREVSLDLAERTAHYMMYNGVWTNQ